MLEVFYQCLLERKQKSIHELQYSAEELQDLFYDDTHGMGFMNETGARLVDMGLDEELYRRELANSGNSTTSTLLLSSCTPPQRPGRRGNSPGRT